MECPLSPALQSTLAILAKVGPGDMDAPTPCVSWNVRALINHFVGTSRWWASLAAGVQATPADTDFAAGDFVAEYEESIALAVGAFGAEGVLNKLVQIPFGTFPGAVVRDMAATEQFTHGWDLARAIGYHAEFDPELAATLLSRAQAGVSDEFRGPDGQALFAPIAEAPAGAGPADQLAAFLGRSVGR